MASRLARPTVLLACVFLLQIFHHGAVFAQTVDEVANNINTNLLAPYLSVPDGKVDLVFVVDQSAFSAEKTSRGFLYMVNFVKELLSGFTVDSDHTRVAVITFSREATVEINDLDSRQETKCTVFSRLDELRAEVPKHPGLTATTGALRAAREVLTESRSDGKKAVILITDSYSTIGAPPEVASRELRSLRWTGWDSNQGSQLEVYAVGVSGADEVELESVVSSSPNNVFNIDSFSSLRRMSKLIHQVPGNSSWEVTSPSFCTPCDSTASCACDTGLGQYHCICNAGYHGDGTTCQACSADTYKDSTGPGICTACPENAASPTGATSVEQCTCREGYEGPAGGPCREILCPALPAVPHATSFHIYSPANEAQVNTYTTCRNTPGDFCYFQCDVGFTTSDVSRLYCEGGVWDRGTPTCEVVICDGIDEEAGMTVTYDHSSYGDYAYETVATITCNEGYRTYGSTERTCTEDGTWNGTETACEPTKCPSLVPPVFGQISPATCSNSKPDYQTVCTYSCDDGFNLTGPASRTCQSNDQWTDASLASTCEDVQPPNIVCPPGATLYSDDGSKKTFSWASETPDISDNSGSYNSYTVTPSYENPHDFLVGIHSLTYRVTDSAGNEASCNRQLIVEASQPPSLQSCPGTTTIEVNDTTGALDWTDPVYWDADNRTVSVECDRTKGESASLGTHNIHCNAQGYTAVNLCSFQVILKAPDCTIPAEPLHGSVSCTATATHQERCTVSCDEGYEFAVDPESEYLCSYAGDWSHEPNWPNCAEQSRTGISTQRNEVQYELTANITNCSAVKDEIRSSFNDAFEAQGFVQSLCGNYNCSLSDIEVNCDTARRKRDVAEKSPMSARRQLKRANRKRSESRNSGDTNNIHLTRKKRATYQVLIVFITKVVVVVPAGGTVTSNDQSDIINIQDEFFYELDDLVSAGNFDITITIDGTSVTLNVDDTSYAANDAELDTTCEDGQVSKTPSSFDAYCVNCPVGSYKSGDNCELCDVGQYQDQEAQMSCVPCPDGTNTTGMGATNVTQCKKFCTPGSYSSTGLENCTPCETGSYQPNEQSTSCEQCSTGTSTEGEGSTSAEDCKAVCPVGSSSPTGVEPCSPCAEHTYQPGTGQQQCELCPVGYETDSTGGTSKADCKAHQLYVLTITLFSTPDLTTYNENFMKMFNATGLVGEMTVTEIIPTNNKRSSSRLTTCIANHVISSGENRPGLATFSQAFRTQLGTGKMGDLDASTDDFSITIKDPCNPTPCVNGMCQEDPISGYTCSCTAGFTGTNCETDIDDCEPDPCQHDSTCRDGINMFTCDCTPGYTGTVCEIDINDCSPNPCENGASCTDEVNDYDCYCVDGYDGKNCSVNIDDCDPSPCQHGTCNDLVDDYTCTCTAGFSGEDCDIDIDECQTQPCQHGGTCEDLINAYRCSCVTGFEGDNCEVDIDECASDPCENGATCDDQEGGYKCLCPVGFIGANCEHEPPPDFDLVMDGSSASYAVAGNVPDLTAFTLSFWMNTADQFKFGTPFSYIMDTWQNRGDNLLTLSDYSGFELYVNGESAYTSAAANTGQWTHVAVTWQSSDGAWQVFLNGNLEDSGTGLATGQVIPGGGTIVLGQQTNPSVSSPDARMAFDGQLSRLNLYSSVLSPGDITTLAQGCSNDLGTMRGWTDFLGELGTPEVQESPSYCGDTDECKEEDICNSLGDHGQCVNLVGNYSCSCEPGYTGSNCDKLINFCDSLPCENGALCTQLVNDYNCHCINAWGGKNCTEGANFCQSDPCENGGTCTSLSDGHKCVCPSGPFDPNNNCKSTDLCAGINCENGGTCDDSSGSCNCPSGFEGAYCGIDASIPCEASLCLNGGTCDGSSLDYTCHCVSGTGTNCEDDACSSNPCQNGGICARNETQENSFICGCADGFEGELCDEEIDYCASNPCKNNGTCVNQPNDFDCFCPNGFTGQRCEAIFEVCTENQKQSLCKNGGSSYEDGNQCKCTCPEDSSVCTSAGLLGGFSDTCECSQCFSDDDDDDDDGLYCVSGTCVVNDEGEPACDCDRRYSGKHCAKEDEENEYCNLITLSNIRYIDIHDQPNHVRDMGALLATKTLEVYEENGYNESWRINATYNNISKGPGGEAVVELAMIFIIPAVHGGEYDPENLKRVVASRESLGSFDVSAQMEEQCAVEGKVDLLIIIAASCGGGAALLIIIGVVVLHFKKKKRPSRPSSKIGPSPQEHTYEYIAPRQGYENQAYVDRHREMRMRQWLSRMSEYDRPEYDNDDQASERPTSGRPRYENESEGGSTVDFRSVYERPRSGGIHGQAIYDNRAFERPTSGQRPQYENESEGGSSVDLDSYPELRNDSFMFLQPGRHSMDPAVTNRMYPNGPVTPSDIRIPMKPF